MTQGNLTSAKLLGSIILLAYIMGLIGGNLSGLFSADASNESFFEILNSNNGQVRLSVLLDLICSVANIFWAVLFYQVLKSHHSVFAFSGLFIWIIATTILAVSRVVVLVLLGLGNEYSISQDGGFQQFYFQLGQFFEEWSFWGYSINLFFFGIGGIVFYTLFYKSALIPKSISVFGFIAATMVLIGVILNIFNSSPGIIMYAPEGLFEPVLALWLIIKGFSKPLKLQNEERIKFN